MKIRTLDKRSLEDYLVKMDFLGYRLCSISKEWIIREDKNPMLGRKNGKTMAQLAATFKTVFIVKHYEKT